MAAGVLLLPLLTLQHHPWWRLATTHSVQRLFIFSRSLPPPLSPYWTEEWRLPHRFIHKHKRMSTLSVGHINRPLKCFAQSSSRKRRIVCPYLWPRSVNHRLVSFMVFEAERYNVHRMPRKKLVYGFRDCSSHRFSKLQQQDPSPSRWTYYAYACN